MDDLDNEPKKGAASVEYHKRREKKREAYKYRLLRRTDEHIEKGAHVKTFNLPELRDLFELQGFRILKAEKFMMSPIGFPSEIKIERVMKAAKLDFLLLNQLVVGQKIG